MFNEVKGNDNSTQYTYNDSCWVCFVHILLFSSPLTKWGLVRYKHQQEHRVANHANIFRLVIVYVVLVVANNCRWRSACATQHNFGLHWITRQRPQQQYNNNSKWLYERWQWQWWRRWTKKVIAKWICRSLLSQSTLTFNRVLFQQPIICCLQFSTLSLAKSWLRKKKTGVERLLFSGFLLVVFFTLAMILIKKIQSHHEAENKVAVFLRFRNHIAQHRKKGMKINMPNFRMNSYETRVENDSL